MDFRLLGSVEARRQGRRVGLGRAESAKTRCILAVLLRTPGELVTTQALSERVWGQQPPAPESRYKYIGWLRSALQPLGVPLIQRDGGYLLEVDPEDVDLHRFRRLVAEARACLARGAAEEASALVDDALALWEGTALTGLSGAWVELFRSQLDGERREAIVLRVRAAHSLGDPGGLVDRLAGWEAEFPLDETITGLLMLELYRAGRSVEALSCYQRVCDRMRGELDTDPGPHLADLAARIQARDPALLGPPPEDGADTTAPPGTPVTPSAGTPVTPSAGTPAARELWVVPRQLPVEVSTFSGRASELARLSLLLRPAGVPGAGEGDDDRTEAASIVVIDGMAGVGKSAIALHWAHQVVEHFPDGQLYADLHGFDAAGSPAGAGDVVRDFLDALEVPPSRIPRGWAARVALYRSLLAGRRVLVLLDNVCDVGQVRPLLPGSPGCRVLVTSRHRLTGLVTTEGARSLGLRPLAPDQARELLAQRLGTRRVVAQPDAVADLVQLCAGLPLALSIVAARAAAQPECPLSVLVDELEDTDDRLDVLDGGDRRADLRAVLSTSHRFVSPPAARLLRLLSEHPGPDISVAAAASLGQLSHRETRAVLRELTQAHLLEQPSPGRFTCHELLRVYEREQAREIETESGRRAATRHVLDYYIRTAFNAARRLAPHRVPPVLGPAPAAAVPEEFRGARQALSWFASEYAVLLATVDRSAERSGAPDREPGPGRAGEPEGPVPGWHLPWAMATFMDRRGRWADLVRAQGTALATAEREGDGPGLAHAHHDLGRALVRLGALADAEQHLQQALLLRRRLGDVAGQAEDRRALAWLATLQGRHTAALDEADIALDLCLPLQDPAALAAALTTSGRCRVLAGGHAPALDLCRRALRLHREAENAFGLADTWRWLGRAHHHLGHLPQALAAYEDALRLFHDLGDGYQEATTLVDLGDTHLAAGRQAAAHRAWWPALSILEDLHHPDVRQVTSRLRSTGRTGRTGRDHLNRGVRRTG